MEETSIPYCEPAPSDVLPMLIIAVAFLVGGWLFRRWRRKRTSKTGR